MTRLRKLARETRCKSSISSDVRLVQPLVTHIVGSYVIEACSTLCLCDHTRVVVPELNPTHHDVVHV